MLEQTMNLNDYYLSARRVTDRTMKKSSRFTRIHPVLTAIGLAVIGFVAGLIFQNS
ncbi:MAG: hypothetical protein AB7F59_09405 [Bdellovibrionales bacterium]